jgi:hypothetical protein
MTTRQHYAVDVFAGFAMALIVYRLFHRNPKKVVEQMGQLAA